MKAYMEINDKYNPIKVWVIKITNCGHYYVNQKIAGKLFNKKFQKTTKAKLLEIGLNV